MSNISPSSSKKKKKKQSKLPDHLEDMRANVTVGPKGVSNATGIYSATAFKSLGYDNSFSMKRFKKDFRVQFISEDPECLVFDVVGIDAPIANALRRIMIAEVPTMAIDKVKLFQNTSVIQDEVLCHRLGLIPIQVDPRRFEYVSESGEHSEKNTTVFTLEVHCTRVDNVPDSAPPHDKFNNSLVYSRELVWVPQGAQATRFEKPIRPAYDDILIAKLRPGQSIEAELWVEKGVGRTHAKWSPVATASYRLHPLITFKRPVMGEEAVTIKNKCPMSVFDIEESGKLVAARPRNCSMCRECVRDPPGEDVVEVKRVRNHFIFSVETTGAYSGREVFVEAVKILVGKAQHARDALASH